MIFNNKKTKILEPYRWRTQINEFERDNLIPGLKERLESLKRYFETIIELCEHNRKEPTFGAILEKLVHIPPGARTLTPNMTQAQMSEKFFGELVSMTKENFINPIDEALALFKDEITLKIFGNILNKTNYICGSVLNSKSELFLYEFSWFVSIHDKQSGKMVDVVPNELTVLLMPFSSIIRNMGYLAEWTSKTIHTWQEQEMKWRTSTLDIANNRLNRTNQILTILVALSLSAVFLFGAKPIDKYDQDRLIASLEARLSASSNEIEMLRNNKKELLSKIEQATKKNKAVSK